MAKLSDHLVCLFTAAKLIGTMRVEVAIGYEDADGVFLMVGSTFTDAEFRPGKDNDWELFVPKTEIRLQTEVETHVTHAGINVGGEWYHMQLTYPSRLRPDDTLNLVVRQPMPMTF